MTYWTSGVREGELDEFLLYGSKSDLALVIPIRERERERYLSNGMKEEAEELLEVYSISD